MNNKKLGKGLSALLGDSNGVVENEKKKSLINIPINKIQTNKDQPRSFFDEDKINELANSLKSIGLIEPIIVSKENDDNYRIIAGERRYRAAKVAGFKEIPSIVKDDVKDNLLEIMLVENIQREDLNPIEEAMCFDQILKNKQITHEQLSTSIGKSRSYITNHLRLLSLDDHIKKYILEGKISMGHAKMLVNVSKEKQKELVKEILDKNISVRALEKSIKNNNNKTYVKKSAFILAVEDLLRHYFQTKILINLNSQYEGKIEILVHGKEDIEKIIEKIEDIK